MRAPLVALESRLTAEGAVPRFVSFTLGSVEPTSGDAIEVDVSLEAAPSVLYDAVVLPSGAGAIRQLRKDGRTLEFIKDQYRHCKPILALGGKSYWTPATFPPRSRPESLIPASSSRPPTRAVLTTPSSRPSPGIGISLGKPIHRACDPHAHR